MRYHPIRQKRQNEYFKPNFKQPRQLTTNPLVRSNLYLPIVIQTLELNYNARLAQSAGRLQTAALWTKEKNSGMSFQSHPHISIGGPKNIEKRIFIDKLSPSVVS